ncbi:MAG: class I SAM-dependent methyltransferase [Ignavibacteria bacterium]|nr:class I SAM-dependent methyltransferase [Ignavibacteria bacterium]
MTRTVNYNEISPVYNDRYKVSPLDGINNFLLNLISKYCPKQILEVGCGTCYWLNSINTNNANLFGADYSIGMLKQAKESYCKNFMLINADANQLPLKKKYFDLILCINAIHHFSNYQKFITDVSKLINPNGYFCIVGLDPRDKNTDWYLYKYFEGTFEMDLMRYPEFTTIQSVMDLFNFTNIKIEIVHSISSQKIGEEVLTDHFIDKRGASQLALLSDSEFQNGINKIKTDIANAKKYSQEIIFNTKMNFYAITGQIKG